MRKLLILLLGAVAFAAYAQVNTSSEPAGGTTQTEDANASVGDDTSDPAKSTDNKMEHQKNAKAKKKHVKNHTKHHEKHKKTDRVE